VRVPTPAVAAPATPAPAADDLTHAAAPSEPLAPEPLDSEASVDAAVELAMATETVETPADPAPDAFAAQEENETPLSVEAEIAAALSDSQIW
jgi:hypothetical protein